MFNSMTEEEYQEFARRWPGALAYLTHSSLVHELDDLRNEAGRKITDPRRKQWVTERIFQLSELLEGNDQP